MGTRQLMWTQVVGSVFQQQWHVRVLHKRDASARADFIIIIIIILHEYGM